MGNFSDPWSLILVGPLDVVNNAIKKVNLAKGQQEAHRAMVTLNTRCRTLHFVIRKAGIVPSLLTKTKMVDSVLYILPRTGSSRHLIIVLEQS